MADVNGSVPSLCFSLVEMAGEAGGGISFRRAWRWLGALAWHSAKCLREANFFDSFTPPNSKAAGGIFIAL